MSDLLENRVKELEAQNHALLAQVRSLDNALRQHKLIHIGFTNESQVQYVNEQKEDGTFYPSSDNGCYIPVYMLDVHAHRVGANSEIYKEHCELWKQRQHIDEIRAEAAERGYYQGFKDGLVIECPRPDGTNTASAVNYQQVAVENAARIRAEQYSLTIRNGGEV